LTLQEALERFRKLSPADRLCLLKKGGREAPLLVQATRRDLTPMVAGWLDAAESSDVYCLLRARSKGGPGAATIKWLIDNGESVKKGDKLIELGDFDDAAVRKDLRARRAAVRKAVTARMQVEEKITRLWKDCEVEASSAQAAVGRAEAALKEYDGDDPGRKRTLKDKIQRARRLVKQVRARARAQEAQALVELRARAAVVERAEARMAEVEIQPGRYILRATGDGLLIYYYPGQPRWTAGREPRIVAEGEPVYEGQKLLRICDLKRMIVALQVNEDLIRFVRPGQQAAVRVDALPGRRFTGRVKDVADIPGTADVFGAWDRSFRVVVALDKEFAGLKPWMSAQVQMTVARRPRVLTVPLESVLDDGRKQSCFVYTFRGIRERKVTTGLGDESVVEVRSGLEEGERVLLDPRALLRRLRPALTRAPGPSPDVGPVSRDPGS
jgi:hypothetical protein